MQFETQDVFLTFAAVAAFLGMLIILFVSVIVINYRKNAKQHLESIRLIYETQEQERDRIAKDLHDDLGAILSIISIHSNLLTKKSDVNDMRSASSTITGFTDQAIRDLRLIVRNLVPKNIEENGWIAELVELNNAFTSKNGRLITITAKGPETRFRSEVEINLYRIVQELINNSLKHAQATAIDVMIEISEKMLTIDVNDNGRGIQSESGKKGHGSKNIQTRVAAYKGSLEFTNNENGGAHFIIRFELFNLV